MSTRISRAKSFFIAACMVATFSMQLTPAYAISAPSLAVGTVAGIAVSTAPTVLAAVLQCKSVQKAIQSGISAIVDFFSSDPDTGDDDVPAGFTPDTTAAGAAADAAEYASLTSGALATATTLSTTTLPPLVTTATGSIADAVLQKGILDTIPVVLVLGTSGPNTAAAYIAALALAKTNVAAVNTTVNAINEADAEAQAYANGAFVDANAAEDLAAQTTANDDPDVPTDAAEIAQDQASAAAASASDDEAYAAAASTHALAVAAKATLNTLNLAALNSTTSVNDTVTAQKLDTVIAALGDIQKAILQTQATTAATKTAAKTTAAATNANANQTDCLDKVERAAAQVVLRSVTKDTVNWINSGFHGQPLYVQDTTAFLNNIRKRSLSDLTNAIGLDPNKFPFGKTVAQQLINSTNNYFEQADAYTLNQVIAQQVPGANSTDFTKNFANGGWTAFSAQFNEGNNPYGFSFAAAQTLATRTSDTSQNSPTGLVLQQLARNGGFLDSKSCVNPANDDLEFPDPTCKQWQTDTPGSIIVSKLENTLNIPEQQLGLGQNITTDTVAIINALLSQGVKYSLKQINTNTL